MTPSSRPVSVTEWLVLMVVLVGLNDFSGVVVPYSTCSVLDTAVVQVIVWVTESTGCEEYVGIHWPNEGRHTNNRSARGSLFIWRA